MQGAGHGQTEGLRRRRGSGAPSASEEVLRTGRGDLCSEAVPGHFALDQDAEIEKPSQLCKAQGEIRTSAKKRTNKVSCREASTRFPQQTYMTQKNRDQAKRREEAGLLLV